MPAPWPAATRPCEPAAAAMVPDVRQHPAGRRKPSLRAGTRRARAPKVSGSPALAGSPRTTARYGLRGRMPGGATPHGQLPPVRHPGTQAGRFNSPSSWAQPAGHHAGAPTPAQPPGRPDCLCWHLPTRTGGRERQGPLNADARALGAGLTTTKYSLVRDPGSNGRQTKAPDPEPESLSRGTRFRGQHSMSDGKFAIAIGRHAGPGGENPPARP
jgi:hypothetical protein